MPFFDGTAFPLDPRVDTSIALSFVNTARGGYNYFEVIGDYAGLGWPPGTLTPDVFRGVSPQGQTPSTLKLSHSQPPDTLSNPDYPRWVIYRNEEELTSLIMRAVGAGDPDGDYGVFIRPLPFSDAADTFAFTGAEFPEYLVNPEPSPFQFTPLFSSSGGGDDRVRLWEPGSVYARYLTGFDGGPGNDRITGGALGETISGSGGIDRLLGSGGTDALFGGDDDDLLDGGMHADTLTGGNGSDTFRFASDDALRRADRIEDFNPFLDQILLEKDIFRALDGRRLERAEFAVISDGKGRIDATDRIIYDQVTGALMYDRDGNPAGPGRGAEAKVFAVISPWLSLGAADFDLV